MHSIGNIRFSILYKCYIDTNIIVHRQYDYLLLYDIIQINKERQIKRNNRVILYLRQDFTVVKK